MNRNDYLDLVMSWERNKELEDRDATELRIKRLTQKVRHEAKLHGLFESVKRFFQRDVA
jgi:hypothetical protein